MTPEQFLLQLLEFAKALFSLVLVITIGQIFAYLLLASSIQGSKDPEGLARSLFCCIMKGIGVFLMSLGAIPTLLAVFTGQDFSTQIYLSLLLVFAAGGILYLWHDTHLRETPLESKRIPCTIYLYTFKTIGHLSLLLGVLYICLAITLDVPNDANWIAVPAVMFIYGTLLCWMTASSEYSIKHLKITPSAKKRTTGAVKHTTKRKKK